MAISIKGREKPTVEVKTYEDHVAIRVEFDSRPDAWAEVVIPEEDLAFLLADVHAKERVERTPPVVPAAGCDHEWDADEKCKKCQRPKPMESWREVWRNGFAPGFSTEVLEHLWQALKIDDIRLAQGSTCTPPPLMCVADWPVEACDFLVFGEWAARGFNLTVGEAEEIFAKRCFDADTLLKEPAACRWLLNFWDDSPRNEALSFLLAEVERELARRLTAKPTETSDALPQVS